MMFMCSCLSLGLFFHHLVEPLFEACPTPTLDNMRHPHALCTHYSVISSADGPDLPVRVFIHDPHAACKDTVGVWWYLASAYLVCMNMCAYLHIVDWFRHLELESLADSFLTQLQGRFIHFLNVYILIFYWMCRPRLAHSCRLVWQSGHTASEGLVDYATDLRLRPGGGRFRFSTYSKEQRLFSWGHIPFYVLHFCLRLCWSETQIVISYIT